MDAVLHLESRPTKGTSHLKEETTTLAHDTQHTAYWASHTGVHLLSFPYRTKHHRLSLIMLPAAADASSIQVAVRVRPFTIREAAQLTRNDDGPLFLGDGSLAAVPTPQLKSKGIRSVIKVVDEKCLYVGHTSAYTMFKILMPCAESSTHRKKMPYSDLDARQWEWASA